MYVPKKMVQNEFKELVCPRPKDLYSRIGARNPSNTGASDGSDYSEVVSYETNPNKIFARMSYEDYLRYVEELRKAEEEKEKIGSSSEDDS